MPYDNRDVNLRLDKLENGKVDMETFKQAFSGGDHDGHRRYHDTLQEMLEERRRLRQAIQEKTISGLVWMALIAVGGAIWHQIQQNIIHPPH